MPAGPTDDGGACPDFVDGLVALLELPARSQAPGLAGERQVALRWDPIREHPRFKALLVKYANPETAAR